MLEDIPDILRFLFRDRISRKYKQKWMDNTKCGEWLFREERFTARLNPNQVKIIKNGNTNVWDISLLVHALLYSSQLLLVKDFPGNKVYYMRRKDDFMLASSSPHTNFSRYVRRRNTLLIDIGSNELIKVEVVDVTPTEIFLKYPIKGRLPETLTVYQCSQEWYEVDSLSKIRNAQFAHCRHARLNSQGLNDLVRNVEASYRGLGVPSDRIDVMSAIKSGMCLHSIL